jgi:TctA family transporter
LIFGVWAICSTSKSRFSGCDGFILGPIVVLNLRRADGQRRQLPPLVTRPISLTFLLVAAVSLRFTVRKI